MKNILSVTSKDYSVYIIGFFMVLSVIDIIREYAAGESVSHLTFEIVVLICATAWSFYLWYRWLTAKQLLHHEIAEKLKLNNEYREWKTKNQGMLNGMNNLISNQFQAWDLTPAEKDVAFLLLKGLPFKEIASVRGGSEKTIRHHALKIYQKSGLQGRTELFAYFFEDLFTPESPL